MRGLWSDDYGMHDHEYTPPPSCLDPHLFFKSLTFGGLHCFAYFRELLYVFMYMVSVRITFLFHWEGGGVVLLCCFPLLLSFVARPLITHPFRDGAPFLLLTETLLTFRCLSRFVYAALKTVDISYSRPVSPSVATTHLLV